MMIGISNYHITFQAINDDRVPMGYASILLSNQDDEKTGHLMGLIRHSDFKGQGICRKLTMERIMMCKYLGCKKIVTGVYSKHLGIISMYKDLGFKEIQSDSDKHTKLCMRLDINE